MINSRLLRRFMVAGAFVLAALVATAAGGAFAAPGESTAPDLGRPTAYVTDDAGILKAREEGRIERYLGKVERELGVQCALVTIETTAPQSIEEFAVELFEKWGIGGKQSDEGLLLVVAFADRTVRFEVGYGLEGTLPDGRVGGIIRERITPAMRAGRYGDGLLAALVDAARYIAEEKGLPAPLPDDVPAVPPRRKKLPIVVLLSAAVLVFLVLALSGGGGMRGGRRYRRHGRAVILPGGWGGGFSGGGFGGGFGGGASGGGFGGFGGGASGGGGATGSW